jgi:hypothetical protein
MVLIGHPIEPCTTVAVDEMELCFEPLPEVYAGADGVVCEDGSFCLTEATETHTASVEWSTLGDGSFDDVNDLNTCYHPGSADVAAGSVDLVLSGNPNSPCTDVATDTLTLQIQLLPAVDAGDDQTICEDQSFTANPTITASGSYGVLWSHNGTGSFDDPTLENATYTPGAGDAGITVTLTITVTPGEYCSTPVTDDVNIHFDRAPVADAGGDATTCEQLCTPPYNNGRYELVNATVEYACGQLWTTSGDGTFSDDQALNPVYYLGDNDMQSLSVELCLIALPCDPCTVADTSCMTLYVQQFPDADAGPDVSICETESAQLDGTAVNASAVYWDYANVGEGDGTFSDPAIDDPLYTPGPEDIARGYVDLAFIAYPLSPCTLSDADVMKVSISLTSEVYAGINATICENGSYDLTDATAGNYESLSW